MPISVCYAGTPRPVRFLERPNRYLALVEDRRSGATFSAHVPNPGRMTELLLPGRTVGWAIPCQNLAQRKTRFDLVCVVSRGTLVSIDSRVANRLVRRALERNRLRIFGRGHWQAEVGWRDCRFDFARRSQGPIDALLEVKSSNLRIGHTAFFPDAPTVRGTHHVDRLIEATQQGVAAGLLMMIQRTDVDSFAPNADMDPSFARAFERALVAGVRVAARTMRVSPDRVEWGRPVPVRNAPQERRFLPSPGPSGR
ncbi:MAG: DNA/RNA nuclease SfsA [Thermoplasmata archaeon]|nr:DNA/RNA nuclease SfsA [Thermoplasmata archaeon]